MNYGITNQFQIAQQVPLDFIVFNLNYLSDLRSIKFVPQVVYENHNGLMVNVLEFASWQSSLNQFSLLHYCNWRQVYVVWVIIDLVCQGKINVSVFRF